MSYSVTSRRFGILPANAGKSGHPYRHGTCQHGVCRTGYLFIPAGKPDPTRRRRLYAGGILNRAFGKQRDKLLKKEDETAVSEETSSSYVITISREFGSGGREIGKLLAERFGFAKESALIHELSQRGSCIIVGRLANYILKDMPTAYHVFISADLDAEAARVSARDNISPQSAAAKVKKVNHERTIHCRHFTKTDWGNVKNYDLCIKSDDFGVAETAQITGDLFQKKMGL